MEKTNFSVLMSVYWKEDPSFLEKAIESICNQTLKPTEIVLVIEGKLTKELDDILKELKEKYKIIKTYNIAGGKGLGTALKYGLTKCNYEYIMRADTDDICVNNRFETEIKYMHEHPEIDVLGTAIYEFKNNINEPNLRIKYMPTGNLVNEYAKKRNPINHMTVCMKKSSIIKAGNYNEQPLLEDYELWIRMINNGMILENINIPLVYARIGNSFEKRRGNKKQITLWKKIQKYMYDNKMINKYRYSINMLNMYVMVYTPNFARKFAYKYILRRKKRR